MKVPFHLNLKEQNLTGTTQFEEKYCPQRTIELKILVPQLCPTLCDLMDCMEPARLLCPWNSPSKHTGVGSHSLLQTRD